MKASALLPALLTLMLAMPSLAAAEPPSAALERDAARTLPTLEREGPAPRPGDAVAEPWAAWAAAHDQLPPGHVVRRIAFARHGMFVFFSAPGDEAVWGQFLGWQEDAWQADAPEPRDPQHFSAEGVPADAVDRALARLLQMPEWQARQGRLLSFMLENHEGSLFWTLVPEPEGGLREGEALETIRLPFEPD